MATPQQTTNKNQNQQWIVESISLAQKLMEHTKEISRSLFANGDLTEYLDLMCRLPYYHFLNLLLIYEKYPTATCLAGTRVWGKLYGSQYPLKSDQSGKSITLLAPFTNGSAGELVWYSVNVYDISQTLITNYEPPGYVYTYDEFHLDLLIESVIDVLAARYSKHVLPEPNSSLLQRLNIPGRVTSHSITVSNTLTDQQKLYWLTENICQNAIASKPLSPRTSSLLTQTLCSCLFKAWGITESIPTIPQGSYSVIPVQEQHEFLNVLQHTFYAVNQQISSAYLDLRNESDLNTFIL